MARADQAHDRGVIREDAHDIGAPFHLLVQAFDRVGGVQLGAGHAHIQSFAISSQTWAVKGPDQWCSHRWILDALEQAVHEGRPVKGMGLVHHSDRGSQYLSIKYTERLAEAGIEPSVCSMGDSFDNALAETINGLFRAEVTLFLDDGRVAIDNNTAERAIKPVVIGRKNFLFAGSDAGGETLASAVTIIETAKFNGLDPQAYLADIFARVHDHKINRIDERLPWNWKPVGNQAAAA